MEKSEVPYEVSTFLPSCRPDTNALHLLKRFVCVCLCVQWGEISFQTLLFLFFYILPVNIVYIRYVLHISIHNVFWLYKQIQTVYKNTSYSTYKCEKKYSSGPGVIIKNVTIGWKDFMQQVQLWKNHGKVLRDNIIKQLLNGKSYSHSKHRWQYNWLEGSWNHN